MRHYKNTLLLVLLCFFTIGANSQSSKKLKEKADLHYKEKRYATAAKLYEILLEEKEQISIQAKLAFCYKMNNKINLSEALYHKIYSHEKAPKKTPLFYAEVLMYQQNYDLAYEVIDQFLAKNPKHPQALLIKEASQNAPKITPYFEDVYISDFFYNSKSDDNSPQYWNNGIVFSSDRESFKPFATKAGWTGRDYLNIYFSPFQDSIFGQPKLLSKKFKLGQKNSSSASFTKDGTEIYFSRNTVHLSRNNTYNLSLYTSKANKGGGWSNPQILPFSSKEYNYMHPCISPDGKKLYYVSNKPNGQGGTDIWVSRKKSDGSWSRSENLGNVVNTAANEGFPFVDNKGRLYFCSKGHPTLGGFDIFMTEFDPVTQKWSIPINLGAPINSPLDDISIFFFSSGKSGYFTSNRNGEGDDIFLFNIGYQHLVENFVENPNELEENKLNGKQRDHLLKKYLEAEPVITIDPGTFTQNSPKNDESIIDTKVKYSNKSDNVVKRKVRQDLNQDSQKNEKTSGPILRLSEIEMNLGSVSQGTILIVDSLDYEDQVYQVTPLLASQLDKLGNLLSKIDFNQIEIGVHSAPNSTDQSGQILAQYRAQSITNYLSSFIDSRQLVAKGYKSMDATHPLFSSDTVLVTFL